MFIASWIVLFLIFSLSKEGDLSIGALLYLPLIFGLWLGSAYVFDYIEGKPTHHRPEPSEDWREDVPF